MKFVFGIAYDDKILNLFVNQSWITSKARETVALGRELLGGNGILAEFLVAKVLCFALLSISFFV